MSNDLIVSLFNIGAEPQRVPLDELNLDGAQYLQDVISKNQIDTTADYIELPVCGYCWLKCVGGV